MKYFLKKVPKVKPILQYHQHAFFNGLQLVSKEAGLYLSL